MVKVKGLIKRFVCIFTSLCVIFSAAAVFAADEETTKTAVFSEKDKEAYGLIAAISDCEEYLPLDADKVTRGMFISAVCAAAGISPDNGMASAFEDVPMGTDLYGFVSYAVQNSIISKTDSFRPDDDVTADEAVKIVINMFGYGMVAASNGGWPEGYRRVSAQLGLLSGVESGSLTPAGVYRLLFNMLNSDHAEMRIKDGKPEYIVSGSTILEQYYDIRKVTGIVTSNEYTETGSLEGSRKSVKDLADTVGIDNVYYDVKSHSFNDLIGSRVKAYVRSGGIYDNDEIVYMQGYNNNEATVYSGDLRFENNTLYDDVLRKKYKIKKSADIIVNGKVDYSFSREQLEDVIGTIRLIAPDGSSEYSTAIVTDYKYMKVSTFDKQELEIADMESPENRIKITDDTVVTVFSDDDKEYTSLGSITKDSYLAVAASKDSEVMDIIIMSASAEGKISSIDENEIVIGDKSYGISPAFRTGDLKKVKVGYTGSFYVGKNNEIVAVSDMASELKYGYLVNADLTKNIKKTLQLKIFTQGGEMKVFDCSEKIKIDGEPKTDHKTLKDQYFSSPTLLKYGVDGEGKINAIDLPEKTDTYKNADSANLKADDNLTLNSLSGSYYYRNNVFYPSFFGYEATVFFVPLDRTKEEYYKIGYEFNEGSLSDGSQVEAYDVGLDGNAKVICAYMDAEDKTNVPLAYGYSIVVEKVYEKRDEDGNFRTAVRGWSESGFVDILLKEGINIERFNDVGELDTGDIIRVLMKDNEITALVIDFCGREFSINKGSGIAAFNCRSTNYHYQTGSVYSLYNSSLLISKKNLGENVWDYSGANLISVKMPQSVLVVNVKDRKIKSASEGAVKTYLNSETDASRVVVKQTNGNSIYCVIYEGLEDM